MRLIGLSKCGAGFRLNTQKTIIFLTEGSASMGHGHLTRCVALSQAFAERGLLSRFIVHGDDSVDKVLNGLDYYKIDWLSEKNEVYKFLGGKTVFIDTFSISEKMLDEIASQYPVVVIDDFLRRRHHNSVVIDWTINSENKYYFKREISSHYLVGAKYTALRQPFWTPKKYSIKKNIETILITFGSGDIRGLIPRMINLLSKKFPEIKKVVILGGNSKSKEIVESMSKINTCLIVGASAEDMKDYMYAADLAIASGGQTLYELAAVGVPTISVMLIDNQADDILGWQEVGFTEHAGMWDSDNLEDEVEKCIDRLSLESVRYSRSRIGKALIDGQGARRIAGFILGDDGDS